MLNRIFASPQKPENSEPEIKNVGVAALLAMSMGAKRGTTDVLEGYIYSTGVVSPGALGDMRLFTVPLGLRAPQLGTGGPRDGIVLGDAHTNIIKAGELGNAIGDGVLETIRVVAPELAAGVEARLSVVVAGQRQYSAPLAVLLHKTRLDWLAFKVPLLVERTDTLEVRLSFDLELTPNDIPSGFALIRVELGGAFARDVR
jgi:hypothetical protein